MIAKKGLLSRSRAAARLAVGALTCALLAPAGAGRASPLPLGLIPVPEPPNLSEFVKDRAAAVRLGKALFWDLQAGSDGVTACATCHYRAGADPLAVRSRNQVNPGPGSVFDVGGAANYTLLPGDFPFFQVSPVDASIGTGTVTRDRNDIAGSQGIRRTTFTGINLGSAVDSGTPNPGLPFNNYRQVTGRNTPPAVNAVFNYANFWDGRANNSFNGSSPIGPLDVNAGVWVDNAGGTALVKQPISIPNASLASQSVGPPLDDVGMSYSGRTFPELGAKMLSLTPLGQQTVHPSDSVLGSLSRAVLQADGSLGGARGLATTYEQMIKAAFQNAYWSSANTQAGFSQMELNFSLFWGLAIQLYESTLVSDQTPFDHFLAGDLTAMSATAQSGFGIFSSQCAKCHSGSEFTSASVSNAESILAGPGTLIDRGAIAADTALLSDVGFSNIGVRPTADDLGRGATAGFPFPLSFAAQAAAEAATPGSIPFAAFPLPNGTPPNPQVAVDGAFKVPGLRNVELTPPYFHNGSAGTLEEVVEFYARGGNFANAEMDKNMSPVGTLGNEPQRTDLMDFLKALTDERVRTESAPFDHPELLLPQGDPELPLIRLFSKGSDGREAILPPLTIEVTHLTNKSTQTIGGTVEAAGVDVLPAPAVTATKADGTPATVINVTKVSDTGWSADVLGLAQGENTISATAVDLAGVTRTVTKTTLAAISRPVGAIVIENGAAVTNKLLVSLTLGAVAPLGRNVTDMQLGSDPTQFYNFNNAEPFVSSTVRPLSAGDGTKIIYVMFRDSGGSKSDLYFDTIDLDTTPPDLTINVISPIRYDYETISGTVEEGAALIVTASAPAKVSDVKVMGVNWTAKISGLQEGINTVTATATDAAGNATTKSAIIFVDRREPELNIDTVVGQLCAIGLGIAGTVDEERSKVEVECKVECDLGLDLVECDDIKADVVFFDDQIDHVTRFSAMFARPDLIFEELKVEFKDLLEDVEIVCKVKAIDAAGNEKDEQVKVDCDDIRPKLEIDVINPIKLGSSLTVSGTVESGATVSVTAGGGASVGPVTVSGGTWSCQVSGLKAGSNLITVTAVDSHGNRTTKTATINVVDSNGSFTGAHFPNFDDVVKALRMAVGLDIATPEDLLHADLFEDNQIDLADAILILKKVHGLNVP